MNRARTLLLIVTVFSWAWLASAAYAQRGMGDSAGMARRQARPTLEAVSGKLTAITTQPCKGGTGSGVIGTHIVLKTDKGTDLNIDLGWAKAVEPIVKKMTIGKTIKATVFRTEKMPKGRYVAKSLTLGGKSVQLRDKNLRPFWAGKKLPWQASGEDAVDDVDLGRGRGRGWGRRRGWGRGWGRGNGWYMETEPAKADAK